METSRIRRKLLKLLDSTAPRMLCEGNWDRRKDSDSKVGRGWAIKVKYALEIRRRNPESEAAVRKTLEEHRASRSLTL
ncbi:hypothetical protein NQZ68_002140 [Dissostichus eleginoides]|nr:hypothetical protein NQZ68_002140 [Dissostichus eleginoides]